MQLNLTTNEVEEATSESLAMPDDAAFPVGRATGVSRYLRHHATTENCRNWVSFGESLAVLGGIAHNTLRNVTTVSVVENPERVDLKSQIRELLKSAGSDNWDGEGALAVQEEAIKAAMELADKLPAEIKDPDVEATPHGEVDFDWKDGRDAMLTLSMSSDGILAWAAQFADFKTRGTARWTGELLCPVECCLRHVGSRQQ